MGSVDLKIAAFFDGRPGHEKQTKGILNSLKNKCNLEIVPVKIEKLALPEQVQCWMKFFLFPPKQYLPEISNCQLLIGTGTHTHLPMLLAKKKYSLPVVTCMTPAKLLMKYFDIIFCPEHDGIESADNIFFTTGPPNLCKNKNKHDPQRTLILIGGKDAKSHIWSTSEIVSDIERLIQFDDAKNYTVSSSPRTPESTAERVTFLQQKYSNVTFCNFKDTPPGWVEKEYDRSQDVWVTADSMSMVFEALSAGCRVGIIPVRWRKKNSKFIRSEKYLQKNGQVLMLDNFLQNRGDWLNNTILDEAERCAEEIIKRWL